MTALGSCLAALRTVQFVAKRIFKRVTRGRIDRQIDMARLDRLLLFAIDDLVGSDLLLTATRKIIHSCA